MAEKECEHKWLPNGMIIKTVWEKVTCDKTIKQEERVVASCICEKCGLIKIVKV